MDARDHRRFLRTPLALAVENGHLEAAKMLLKHGAHIDACDADGRTPLFRYVSCLRHGLMGWGIWS